MSQRKSVPQSFLAGLLILGSGTYGWLAAHIPNHAAQGDLWVGNLSAPFIFFPMLSGMYAWTAPRAALWGALTGVVEVVGFYLRFLIGSDVMASHRRAHEPILSADDLLRWCRFIAADTPWVFLGITGGAAVAVAVFLVATRRRTWAAVTTGIVFFAEPVAHLLVRTSGVETIGASVLEVAAGALVIVICIAWNPVRSSMGSNVEARNSG